MGGGDVDIVLLFHGDVVSPAPRFRQFRVPGHMEQMDLHAPGPQLPQYPGGLQHILPGFPGQSVDEMDAGSNSSLPEGCISRKKFIKAVPPVNGRCGLVMDGLEAQFHSQIRLLV